MSDNMPEEFTPEYLKKALKAFKKRLKLTRLDEESSLGGGPFSKGGGSGIFAIQAPREYPAPSGKSSSSKASSATPAPACMNSSKTPTRPAAGNEDLHISRVCPSPAESISQSAPGGYLHPLYIRDALVGRRHVVVRRVCCLADVDRLAPPYFQ